MAKATFLVTYVVKTTKVYIAEVFGVEGSATVEEVEQQTYERLLKISDTNRMFPGDILTDDITVQIEECNRVAEATKE